MTEDDLRAIERCHTKSDLETSCWMAAEYIRKAELCFAQIEEAIRLSSENADNLPFLLDQLTKIAKQFPQVTKEETNE